MTVKFDYTANAANPMMNTSTPGATSTRAEAPPSSPTLARESSASADDPDAPPKKPLFPMSAADFNGDKSFGLFSWKSPIRRIAAQLVTHWLFEQVIVVLILASTILLLLDMPHLPSAHPLPSSYFWI